jgi:deferrochelatase/peroxidase EfeB
MSAVDYCDVQGLLRFGYRKLPDTRYYLLRIRDAAAARSWLASAPVSTAETKSPPVARALQVAFTASGLRNLGVREQIVAGFSPEFVNGMAAENNRSRRLGDTGDSDPSKWFWGGPRDRIDLLVILFAAHGEMAEWQQQICNTEWTRAFEGDALSTSDLNGREPFGFIDGISQPELDWDGRRDTSRDQLDYTNLVALGEFVLGYPNEYGKYTERPLLDPDYEGAGTLLPAADDPGKRDFGRHGTYLVLRQLEQDVGGFWNFVNGQTGSSGCGKALAEAMIGRRLDDGAPLAPLTTGAIEGITVAAGAPENRFTYKEDGEGLRCPFGAHIRLANPRNTDFPGRPSGMISRTLAMLGAGAPGFRDDLIASTRFHRLLRRAREYGRPGQDSEAAGLHFVCLNANISRQFEFVQNAWILNGKFNALPDESDPLLGSGDGRFSIAREGKCPLRVTGIPRFITVRGGAYFFMPGLRAIQYFARAAK